MESFSLSQMKSHDFHDGTVSLDDSFQEERPAHDVSNRTRKGIYLAIALSLVVALVVIGLSIAAFAGAFKDYNGLAASSVIGEVLPLAFNIVVAILTDVLSFAHSVSLRWALYKEDRLEYNSNLRLFTSTKLCNSNRWPANLASGFFLIMTYTAVNAALYVVTGESTGHTSPKVITLNAVASMCLGIALVGQVAIALWSLHKSEEWVYSWSANPLNTTLACLNKGDHYRILRRGAMSVHDVLAKTQPGPVRPLKKQQNMVTSYRHVGWMLCFIASALVVDLLFAGIMCEATILQNSAADLSLLERTSTCRKFYFEFTMPPEMNTYLIQLITFFMGVALQSFVSFSSVKFIWPSASFCFPKANNERLGISVSKRV